VTGALDDVVDLPPWAKLLAQFAAAGIAVLYGVKVEVLTNPNVFSAEMWIVLGDLSIPFTLLWIVGVTNAFNLIDGLDGLAAGVSVISCATMLAASLLVPAATDIAVLLAAMAGACIGFLPYNIHPAQVFMGDTGALLLGYVMATVSIVGLFKMYALVTFVVPVLALAIPLADTLCAVVRRMAKGQSILKPDRCHLHHRLLALGLSQKQAVAILYAMSAILGLAAVEMTASGIVRLFLLLTAVLLAVTVGIFLFRNRRRAQRAARKAKTGEDGK